MQSYCMFQSHVRKKASNLFEGRTGMKKAFDRHWFYRLINRHQNTLRISKCPCLDDDRGELDWSSFETYISMVHEALSSLSDMRLLINMDETGFGKRPDKGKRKNCVYCIDCSTTPVWRADSDLHHISWVGAITGSCEMLRPFIISTRKTHDPEFHSTFGLTSHIQRKVTKP